ncbi:hypothetical protein [Hirschia baltica]|uniref:Uncharacterized protein n=1 Tax=Hirschia baltica (strain ATCC 49814 / DSM 5838 / IFAM 1418) TaxID=582402 RepID=C6XN43_HIRBI|nr:hypothetical protein [Hirschia baltica]ACT58213.1 hypothetical protein Hbal_0511 [Hirschia baltica ATCC 49814]
MTQFLCQKCQHDLGGAALKGKCPKCGASFKAKLSSKIVIFGSIFLGFMFGPMVITPLAMRNGVDPQSLAGMAIGIMGSITAVLVLGSFALRALKHDWEGGNV